MLVSDEDLVNKLRVVFGHDDFRNDLQKNCVKSVLNGDKDCFVSMPTGSGKSLCFQLPAVLFEGITLVVSPLIALIDDQISSLKNKKIVANTWNSKQNQKQRSAVIQDVLKEKPTTKILYVTPELCATGNFKMIVSEMLEKGSLSLIAVDEAHCVSQWGHDFRPDYLKLGSLRSMTSSVPWIALTATATKQVEEDIAKSLNLKQPVQIFKSSVYRPNLFYEIQFTDLLPGSGIIDLVQFSQKCLQIDTNLPKSLREWHGSGLVFCRSREACDTLADQLCKRGLASKAYHAGLCATDRSSTQEGWLSNKFPVIVATVSFGMGVDKADVRFVAHWTIPASMSGYYQESGRAGRDGKTSFCRLYVSKSEKSTVLFLTKKTASKKQRKLSEENWEQMAKSSMSKLKGMFNYFEELKCRHKSICENFGETDFTECKVNCDVCLNESDVSRSLKTYQFNTDGKTSSGRTNTSFEDTDISNLYGGGRAGIVDEWGDTSGVYMASGGGNSSDESERMEKNERTVLNGVIAEEFAKRRKHKKSSADKNTSKTHGNYKAMASSAANPLDAMYSTLIDAKSSKIAGLTVQIREKFRNLIKSHLEANRLASQSDPGESNTFSCLESEANEVEHSVLKSNMKLISYRTAVLKLIGQIKAATADRIKYERDCQKEDNPDSLTAKKHLFKDENESKREHPTDNAVSSSVSGFEQSNEGQDSISEEESPVKPLLLNNDVKLEAAEMLPDLSEESVQNALLKLNESSQTKSSDNTISSRSTVQASINYFFKADADEDTVSLSNNPDRKSIEVVENFEAKSMKVESFKDCETKSIKVVEDSAAILSKETKSKRALSPQYDNASSVDFSPASKKATLVELKEIAYGVRKILSPFYKNKSITSKDVFKDVARFLTHSCCRSMPLSENLKRVQNVVDNFFKLNKSCDSFEMFSECHQKLQGAT